MTAIAVDPVGVDHADSRPDLHRWRHNDGHTVITAEPYTADGSELRRADRQLAGGTRAAARLRGGFDSSASVPSFADGFMSIQDHSSTRLKVWP